MGALTALFARRRQPDIVKQALAFRRDLIRGNDAALREMARVHMATWKRLRSQFDQMSRQIAAATEELGGLEAVRDLHPSWIFRQQRYADLMWQCEQELLYFTRAAAAQVRMQQTAAMQLGQQHTFRLVDAQMPRELTGTWNRMPVEALQDLVGVLQDGSPLSYKFAGLAEETAAGIKDTIAAGFAQGWNPRKIAREIKRSYDGALANALLTCRTETMRAYRGAAHASYQANSDVVDGWIRVAAKNGRSCIACLAQDGTFHPLTERLHDHPAGRCVAIPHTRPWNELFPGLDLSGVKETSVQPWNAEDSFKRLSEADQRRMMGGAKFRLWKEGKISLSDLATKQRSKVWGDHYRPTTLKELVARGKVTRDEAKWASKRQTAAEPGSGATFGRLEVSKRQASRILKSPESAARILRAETKKAANKQSRVETSAVFDASKKGLFVNRAVGGKIQYSDAEVAKMRGGLLIHSHPLGYPPSVDDVMLACDHGLKEMQIVTSRSSYRLRPPASGWNRTALAAAIRKHIILLTNEIDIKNDIVAFYEELWRRVSREPGCGIIVLKSTR